MPTEPDMHDVAAALDAIEAELRKIDALTDGSSRLVALAAGACKAAKQVADQWQPSNSSSGDSAPRLLETAAPADNVVEFRR